MASSDPDVQIDRDWKRWNVGCKRWEFEMIHGEDGRHEKLLRNLLRCGLRIPNAAVDPLPVVLTLSAEQELAVRRRALQPRRAETGTGVDLNSRS